MTLDRDLEQGRARLAEIQREAGWPEDGGDYDGISPDQTNAYIEALESAVVGGTAAMLAIAHHPASAEAQQAGERFVARDAARHSARALLIEFQRWVLRDDPDALKVIDKLSPDTFASLSDRFLDRQGI